MRAVVLALTLALVGEYDLYFLQRCDLFKKCYFLNQKLEITVDFILK